MNVHYRRENMQGGGRKLSCVLQLVLIIIASLSGIRRIALSDVLECVLSCRREPPTKWFSPILVRYISYDRKQ
jgi:hypothetical protein